MSAQKAEPTPDPNLPFYVRIKKLEIVGESIRLVIIWSSLVAIFYLAFRSVSVLAGRTTLADIGIKVFGTLKISESIAYLVGTGGLLYGIKERGLRRRDVERLTRRTTELELRIDPQRTSSRLTPRGTTRPEDKR